MKIAIPYENGQIFAHFGHTAQFKLYQLENHAVVATELCPAPEEGHGALAKLLHDRQVEALICGGIGGGARQALGEAGIRVYGGVTGDADAAAGALAAGTLQFDPLAQCAHHEHEGHDCGGHHEGHGCGGHHEDHGCGGHSCHAHA